MSLHDCIECWSCPCTCGHEYMRWSDEELYSQIVMLIRVLTIKNSSPLDPIVKNIVDESHIRGIQ